MSLNAPLRGLHGSKEGWCDSTRSEKTDVRHEIEFAMDFVSAFLLGGEKPGSKSHRNLAAPEPRGRYLLVNTSFGLTDTTARYKFRARYLNAWTRLASGGNCSVARKYRTR